VVDYLHKAGSSRSFLAKGQVTAWLTSVRSRDRPLLQFIEKVKMGIRLYIFAHALQKLSKLALAGFIIVVG